MKLISPHTTCEIYVELEPQSRYIHNDHDSGQILFVQFGFETESDNMLPTFACESKKIVVESEYGGMLHDKSSYREGRIN